MACFCGFRWMVWLSIGVLTVSCGPTPRRNAQQADAGAGGTESRPAAAVTRFQIVLARENDEALPARDGAIDTDPAVFPRGVVFRNVIQILPSPSASSGFRGPFLVFPPDVLGSDLVQEATFAVRLNDDRNTPDGPLDRHPVSREWDGDRWFIPLTRIVDISDADPADWVRLVIDLRLKSGQTATREVEFRLRSPLPKLNPVASPAFQDTSSRRILKANSAESESRVLPAGAWIVAEETYLSPSKNRELRIWFSMKGDWRVRSTLVRQFPRIERSGNRGRVVTGAERSLSVGTALPAGVRIRREDGREFYEPFRRDIGFASVRLAPGEKVQIG